MKTAQEIIMALPAKCFGILPIDNSVIIIKAGETGYYPTRQPPASWLKNEGGVEDFVNSCNLEDGVSVAQRMAMEHGSMFGWGCGAADPDNWTEDGKHKKAD